MDEISLHILDVAYNSISAHATLIQIRIHESLKENIIDMTIADNGDGMDKETMTKVVDPFYTTRTTRTVGLGIPLLKQSAEMTGGSFHMNSKLHQGTNINVRFIKDHVDTPVMGNIIETMITLIQANPDIDYEFQYHTDDYQFQLKTSEMKDILGNMKINEPDVLVWIKDYMKEGFKQ